MGAMSQYYSLITIDDTDWDVSYDAHPAEPETDDCPGSPEEIEFNEVIHASSGWVPSSEMLSKEFWEQLEAECWKRVKSW